MRALAEAGGRRGLLEPEIAALVTGLVLGLLDAALLWRDGPTSRGLAVTALVVSLAAAALLAALARSLVALTRLLGVGRWRRSVIGALAGLPVIVPVATLLFRGTWISTRPWAPHGPYVVAPLLLGGTIVALRAAGAIARSARGRAWRLALLVPLLGAAALQLWADARLYPGQYDYLHWALLLGAALTLMAAGWTLVASAGTPSRLRWLAPLVLFAGLSACAVAALRALDGQQPQQRFADRTLVGGRLVRVARALVDLDRDGHSIIFGGRDCDNRDPAIHPFAPEVPGNGVDEDCDGVDPAPPPASTAAVPEHVDDAAYRSALAGWRRAPPLAAALQRTAGLNVVLIVLDALRADQVRPAPENAQNHPRLMALLDGSAHFVRAFATGAGTDIGMATLFTGQLDPFAKGNRSLLRAYHDAGFATYGVYQREVERWVSKQFSFAGLTKRKVVINDPGRRDVGTMPTAKMVTDAGLRFLHQHLGQEQPGRFFLWLHYFDIHEHHQVDPRKLPEADAPGSERPPRGLPFYRLTLRHVDGELGRFLDGLAALGLAEKTIVVALGDHGEGLAERPRLPVNHGDVLYNPLVHVPVALRIPAVPPARIAAPVSLADVFPTLLDLSGIGSPPTHGISLVPFILDSRRPELARLVHPLLMYEAQQRGVIIWPHKLLLWHEQGLVELYDLERDYAENHNLVDALPDRARELSRELGRHKLITIDRLEKRKR